MRPALLIVLALAACRGADDRLTPTKLPGFEIALPAWSEVALGSDWGSDAVRVVDAQRGRLLKLTWSPSSASFTADELAAMYASVARAIDGKAKFGAPRSTRIGGHDGFTATLDGDVATAASWFCPDHGRDYSLAIVAPAELRTAVLESVRCHTEPAPKDAAARGLFPRYDPPAGMAREPDEDPTSQAWSDGTSFILLNVGTVNREAGRGDAHHNAERLLRTAIEVGVGADIPITMSRAVGPDGLTRYLGSIVVAEEEGKSEGLMALWVCPGSDLVFIAGHLASEHEVSASVARDHLLRLSCP